MGPGGPALLGTAPAGGRRFAIGGSGGAVNGLVRDGGGSFGAWIGGTGITGEPSAGMPFGGVSSPSAALTAAWPIGVGGRVGNCTGCAVGAKPPLAS